MPAAQCAAGISLDAFRPTAQTIDQNLRAPYITEWFPGVQRQRLAAQLQKRFSDGYTAQFAYTFSRSIDADSEPFGGGAAELQGT